MSEELAHDFVIPREVSPAMLDDVEELLSADQARHLTEMIRTTLDVTWWLLARAHRGKAWTALGYDSFGEYVRQEFHLSRSRAYQLLNQAKVIEAISSAAGDEVIVHVNEATARDVAGHLDRVISAATQAAEGLSGDDAAEAVADAVNDVREQVRNDANDDTAIANSAQSAPEKFSSSDANGDEQSQDDEPGGTPAVGSHEAVSDVVDAEELSEDDQAFLAEVLSQGNAGGSSTPSAQPSSSTSSGGDHHNADSYPAEGLDDDNVITVVDTPDPSLLRRKTQAAYNLYTVLTELSHMPVPQDVLDAVPPEREPMIEAALPAAIAWLTQFHDSWEDHRQAQESASTVPVSGSSS